jgi:hypothetical protein
LDMQAIVFSVRVVVRGATVDCAFGHGVIFHAPPTLFKSHTNMEELQGQGTARFFFFFNNLDLYL